PDLRTPAFGTNGPLRIRRSEIDDLGIETAVSSRSAGLPTPRSGHVAMARTGSGLPGGRRSSAMQAGSAAPTTGRPLRAPAAAAGRRVGGGARAALAPARIAVVLLSVPAAALAKGGAAPTPSWISLASVSGSTATTKPMLGSWVGFATGYPSATKNPWISLT